MEDTKVWRIKTHEELVADLGVNYSERLSYNNKINEFRGVGVLELFDDGEINESKTWREALS